MILSMISVSYALNLDWLDGVSSHSESCICFLRAVYKPFGSCALNLDWLYTLFASCVQAF